MELPAVGTAGHPRAATLRGATAVIDAAFRRWARRRQIEDRDTTAASPAVPQEPNERRRNRRAGQ